MSIKHKRLYIVLVTILVMIAMAAITHRFWLQPMGDFLIVEDDLTPAEVIVVLGGGGTERIRHAVMLYNSGYSKRIIMTGMIHNLPGVTTTWAGFGMNEAVSLGVPESSIILEEKAEDTYDNARYVREIIMDGNFKSAIIVSSPYHMRRARMIFRKEFEDRQDISLQFSSVDDSSFNVQGWWTRQNDRNKVSWEYRRLFICFFKCKI